MENGQNISKRQKLALRLLNEGKRSLRDIAQIANVDKSKLSRIGKCLLSNDDVTLEKLLCPSTYKRGAPSVFTSEEEAMLTERQDSLNSLIVQIASDGRPSWKDGGTL